MVGRHGHEQRVACEVHGAQVPFDGQHGEADVVVAPPHGLLELGLVVDAGEVELD